MHVDIRNLVVAESVRQMLSDNRGQVLWESLTIPMNENDPLEKELYAKLDKQYKYSDAIVRWFRNDRKGGMPDERLKSTYIDGIQTIYDLLKDYDNYVDELKKTKRLCKVSIPMDNGRTRDVDPVNDFPKMRRISGVRELVKALGDSVHSHVKIDCSVARYQITDEDLNNIGILGSSKHVVVWYTRTFESTNKFVFQLWQNAETMDRGDAYGDRLSQSPYCTHAKNHWDRYSGGRRDYMQYWYLRKLQGVAYPTGDLSNPGVATAFNEMEGFGPGLIIAMNDTDNDFLDDDDMHFSKFSRLRDGLGDEVESLSKTLFDIQCHEIVRLSYSMGEWTEYGGTKEACLVLPAGMSPRTNNSKTARAVLFNDATCTTLPRIPAQYNLADGARITIDCMHVKDLTSLQISGQHQYVLGETLFLPNCTSMNVEQVANDLRIEAFGLLENEGRVMRKSRSTAILTRTPNHDLIWDSLAQQIEKHCGFLVSNLDGQTLHGVLQRLFCNGRRCHPAPLEGGELRFTNNAKTMVDRVVRDLKTHYPIEAENLTLRMRLVEGLCRGAYEQLNALYRKRLAELASTVCPGLSFSEDYVPSLAVTSEDMVRAVVGYEHWYVQTEYSTHRSVVMELCDKLCSEDRIMDPATQHLFDFSLFYNPVIDLASGCHETLMDLACGSATPSISSDFVSFKNGLETEGCEADL